jgi:hypothetical protein
MTALLILLDANRVVHQGPRMLRPLWPFGDHGPFAAVGSGCFRFCSGALYGRQPLMLNLLLTLALNLPLNLTFSVSREEKSNSKERWRP